MVASNKYKRKYKSLKRTRATPFRDTGRTIGRSLGGFFGNPEMGSNFGQHAGSMLGSIFGSGDYSNFSKIKTNSLIKSGISNSMVPTLVSSKAYPLDSVTIRKREYIKDITSSPIANTFQNEIVLLQPGDKQSFGWLSQIAHCYQSYRINGCIYEFKSLSADSLNSTNTALGYVTMASQYDVNDPDYVNKRHIENSEGSQSAKPSVSQLHGVECARSSSVLDELYVRDSAILAANSDRRFYDYSKLNIATSAPGTSVILGELWVNYDITFFRSKLPDTLGGNLQSEQLSRTSTTTTELDFGKITLRNIGSIPSISTADDLTFNQLHEDESYLVVLHWETAGNITTLPSITLTTGQSTDLSWTNSSGVVDSTYVTGSPGAAGTVKNYCWTATVIPTGNVIKLTIGTLGVQASGTFGFDAFVTKLDSSVI